MSTTTNFDNIIQIANNKTLSISTIKYGDVPSIKNVGTANDIKLEVTIPPLEQDLDIEIGKVETGDTPSVKKRLMNGKMYLDFVLPIKGDQGVAGPQGDAATIQIGRVSIGNVAKVENVGTENKAILNFTLPYASGQGSYIPSQGSDESSGGDKETAEELRNVTAGINRSAKATEELESTIANILSQVTAMVEQNKVIISRVVNQSEQLTKTLGDRIDANKMSIKAIQMTTIDRSMLDETKSRVANCEQNVALLRGELQQIFGSEVYRTDMKNISDELDRLQDAINTINQTIKQLDDINESISLLKTNGTQDRVDIELLQTKLSELTTTVNGKQDAGMLVTVKDLDAGLKNSIDSISGIRITANQNARKISDAATEIINLNATLEAANQAINDVQKNYADGDKANKTLIDNLSTKVDNQTKAINETIAEIQDKQKTNENKFADAANVYTKTEMDDALDAFLTKAGGDIVGNLKVNGSVTADSFVGRLVGNADSATIASKATYDGAGNEIAKTYVSKDVYNTLAGKLAGTASKAEQAVSQLETFTKQLSDSIIEIDKIKADNETINTSIDALSDEKADKSAITELQSLIASNKEDDDTKRKVLEDELDKFMPKNAVIPVEQIDQAIIEKLNGIETNADAITQVQTQQQAADAKINKNADGISKIQESLSRIDEEVELTKQSIVIPQKVSLETIKQMFGEYMPIDDEPKQPTEEPSTEEPSTEPTQPAEEPTTEPEQPAKEQPSIEPEQPPTEEPAKEEPAKEQPSTEEPEQPSAEEPATEQPTTEPEQPATEEPAAEPTQPSTEEPATEPEQPEDNNNTDEGGEA